MASPVVAAHSIIQKINSPFSPDSDSRNSSFLGRKYTINPPFVNEGLSDLSDSFCLSSPSSGCGDSPQTPVAMRRRMLEDTRADDALRTPLQTPASMRRSDPSMPLTPAKKVCKENPTGFVAKVLHALDNLYKGLNSASSDVSFTVGKTIGNGQHSNVYEIKAEQPLFIEYSNDNLLVKIYREDLVDASNQGTINSFAKNSLEQYNTLKSLDFPVAIILNAEKVEQDGFMIVEKIPSSFDVPSDLDFENLPENHVMTQVKKMFQLAFDKRIYLDLSRDNVRVDSNDRVVLIDFMEHTEEDIEEWENPFALLLKKLLESFSKNSETQAQEVFNYLKPTGADVEYEDPSDFVVNRKQ